MCQVLQMRDIQTQPSGQMTNAYCEFGFVILDIAMSPVMHPASDCLALQEVAALSKPSSCAACKNLCATLGISSEEVNMRMQAQVFGPFAAVNALQVSEYTAPAWASAKASYEAQVAPLEQRLSQQMKAVFGAVLLPALAAAVAEHDSPDSAASAAQPQQVSAAWKCLPVPSDPGNRGHVEGMMVISASAARHTV